jgi:hypothetical protein
VTDWDSAEDRNNRERIGRARQAAEDLFKPTRRLEAGPSPSSPSEPVSTAGPARRQPRIFTLPPRVATGPGREPTPEPKPIRQKTAPRRPIPGVPPSQIGRIRTLASYGMTPAQVAELYEVTVDEIERIITASSHIAKPR